MAALATHLRFVPLSAGSGPKEAWSLLPGRAEEKEDEAEVGGGEWEREEERGERRKGREREREREV